MKKIICLLLVMMLACNGSCFAMKKRNYPKNERFLHFCAVLTLLNCENKDAKKKNVASTYFVSEEYDDSDSSDSFVDSDDKIYYASPVRKENKRPKLSIVLPHSSNNKHGNAKKLKKRSKSLD